MLAAAARGGTTEREHWATGLQLQVFPKLSATLKAMDRGMRTGELSSWSRDRVGHL